MRKFLCFVLFFCLTVEGIFVHAEESQISKYTIDYISYCDTVVASSVVTGYSEVLEEKVSKVRPKRDGFEFIGWSYSEQDYINTPIIQPGDTVKISSSVTLHALWRDLNVSKISYLDGQREIMPSQLVKNGEVRISELVPEKEGFIFAGWEFSDVEGPRVVMPGEILTVTKPVVLIAGWEKGTPELPELEIRDSQAGAVIFGCDNVDSFDTAVLEIRSLASGIKNTYSFREGRVKVDDLPEGAYEAWVVAEKYGIEYKGAKVNVVFMAENAGTDGELTVFMDGRKLAFELPPVLIDGNTFVTLRYFCEYLGADVLWDDDNRTAIITYKGTRMKIKENSNVCVVDGATYFLPAKTVIMSSRLFIPLRSVAEMCNCEVVWDPSMKVYMFSDSSNIFDKNIFSVSGNNGEYMSFEENEIFGSETLEFSGMWVFDTVDEEKGIYEIYNFGELNKPLEVKTSKVEEDQPLRIWEKSGYDGFLWKLTKCGEGEYFIQPANHEKFYLDAVNMCITTEETKVFVNEVYR